MNPILFNLGNFEIRWYSAFIILGLIIGYFGVMSEAKKFDINKNFIVNIIFWAVIFGIIGARLYYVVFNLDYYKENLIEILKVWKGGLAIHGGILFGIVTVLLYCKKYKFSGGKILDIFAPFLLLAQAIGRWGNFFNQEAYGSLTTYSKLKELFVPEFVIDGMFINGHYYLPMFYFESLWCILGFIFLMLIRRVKTIKKGQTACLYLMWYSVGRFFIEMYRTDSLLLGDVRVAQIVSIGLFFISYIILLVKAKKNEQKELYNANEKNNLKF